MGRYTSMLVVFLLALILRTCPAKTINCMTLIANIFPCSNFLKNPNDALPQGNCCNSARKWIDLGNVESLCKCLQPISSQFLPSKGEQLLGLCNLDIASYSPLVKCLVPPFALPPLPFVAENQEKDLKDDLTPPLPFVPLPLIPYGPLPPPVSFVQPAQNQENNVASANNIGADGLLPPLPLVPLPPLPLPPLPLPPLPLVPPVDKHN